MPETPPPLPPGRPHIKRKWLRPRALAGVILPGKRERDAKLRGYAAKTSVVGSLIAIIAFLARGLLAIVETGQGKALTQQAETNRELLRLQAEMNHATLTRFDSIVAVHATDSASWAIVANRLGIMLERAHVDIRPARPGHTTIIVEPAPVVMQQSPAGVPPSLAAPPTQPAQRPPRVYETPDLPRSSNRKER